MSPKVVVIASHHYEVAPQLAEWERHTKVRVLACAVLERLVTSWLEAAIFSPQGIGSKLMAKMGYVPG